MEATKQLLLQFNYFGLVQLQLIKNGIGKVRYEELRVRQKAQNIIYIQLLMFLSFLLLFYFNSKLKKYYVTYIFCPVPDGRPVVLKLNNNAKMALYRSPDYQTSFESMKFNVGFQDGGHLGHLNKRILTAFDLQVTLILPMKF